MLVYQRVRYKINQHQNPMCGKKQFPHPWSSFHILPVVALLRSHYIFEFADKLYSPLFLKKLLSINMLFQSYFCTTRKHLSELSFVSPALDLFHNCCIPSGRMPFHYYSHRLYLITFSLHPSISQFFLFTCSTVSCLLFYPIQSSWNPTKIPFNHHFPMIYSHYFSS